MKHTLQNIIFCFQQLQVKFHLFQETHFVEYHLFFQQLLVKFHLFQKKHTLQNIIFCYRQLQVKFHLFLETHFVEYHLLILATASNILALSRNPLVEYHLLLSTIARKFQLSRNTLCRISPFAFDNCKLNFSSFKKLTLQNIIFCFQLVQVKFQFCQEILFVEYHLQLSTTAS